MDALQPGQELQNIVVRPVYLRAVNAIVQPELQLPCSLYFFREWLPRLGSLRWALVLALRHICSIRQPDGSCRGEVSRPQLAALLGVHEVTISRMLVTARSETQPGWRVLKPDGENDEATGYLARFIPRLRYKYERDPQTGTTRRIGYIIDVIMDDPLAPEDEHRLAIVLAEQILSGFEYQPPSAATVDYQDQNATSGQSVKKQNVFSPPELVSQHAISPGLVDDHIASSDQLKEQNGPGLTLNNNYNYHDLTIPLDLRDKTRIRQAVAPLVEHAAAVLRDDHSTGMFYSTLLQLYPTSLGIFTVALEAAVEAGQANPKLNRGAAFVKMLKAMAKESGLKLRLGRTTAVEVTAEPASVEQCEPAAEEDTAAEGGSAVKVDHGSPGMAEEKRGAARNAYMATMGMSGLQIWQSVLGELRHRTSQANYEMWLKNCCILRIEGDQVIIGAPNRFTRDWVRGKLEAATTEAVIRVLGRPVTVSFEVVEADAVSGIGSD